MNTKSSPNLSRVLPAALPLLSALLTQCAGTPRQFPLRSAYWVDDDNHPLAHRPEKYWSPLVWDAVDHQVFRPISQALLVQSAGEAVNVNSLDEVPDSSWYTNRLATHRLTPQQVADGTCQGMPALDPNGVWLAKSSKADGASLGVIAVGPDGATYLLKTDQMGQGEIPTGADAIGSRLYWAAGFNAPCNRIVYIPGGNIHIAPGATWTNDTGQTNPLTQTQIDGLLHVTRRDPHTNAYRFGASRFIEGHPIGPWRYEDTRPDDPNDVVPHQDRRDVRGSRLLAALMNHWDSREQNTMATYVGDGDSHDHSGGYVKHYFIDFSDCFGQAWTIDGISRRMGHSGYFDPGDIAADFFSLGLIDRPWEHSVVDPENWIFAYYRAEDFEPDHWVGGYPNPAFGRMTERDGAWMARALARLTDEDIAAAVESARFSVPHYNPHLVQVVAARRDRILARYLTRLSPLADFAVEGRTLCASDRAVEAGLYPGAEYTARFEMGRVADEHAQSVQVAVRHPGELCVQLPEAHVNDARIPDGDGARYAVVEIRSNPQGYRAPNPVRAYVYDLGERGYVLAGVER